MDILIRVRVDSSTLARFVIYYQKNGVVPKSRNALVNRAIADFAKVLGNNELLPSIPEGSDIRVLQAAGFITGVEGETIVPDIPKHTLQDVNPTTQYSDLATKVAGGVGRKGKVT